MNGQNDICRTCKAPYSDSNPACKRRSNHRKATAQELQAHADRKVQCPKCFGRGHTWRMRGKVYTAIPCTRCASSGEIRA